MTHLLVAPECCPVNPGGSIVVAPESIPVVASELIPVVQAHSDSVGVHSGESGHSCSIGMLPDEPGGSIAIYCGDRHVARPRSDAVGIRSGGRPGCSRKHDLPKSWLTPPTPIAHARNGSERRCASVAHAHIKTSGTRSNSGGQRSSTGPHPTEGLPPTAARLDTARPQWSSRARR